MNITFKDILNQKIWQDYESYIEDGINHYTRTLFDEIATEEKLNRKSEGL